MAEEAIPAISCEERERFYYRILTLLLWQLGPQSISMMTHLRAPTELKLIVSESPDFDGITRLKVEPTERE